VTEQFAEQAGYDRCEKRRDLWETLDNRACPERATSAPSKLLLPSS
jgi:hypothetical protein